MEKFAQGDMCLGTVIAGFDALPGEVFIISDKQRIDQCKKRLERAVGLKGEPCRLCIAGIEGNALERSMPVKFMVCPVKAISNVEGNDQSSSHTL